MSTQIDQKAYLQKYLSGPSGEKKKKKKKKFKGTGLKVIDVDLDISKMRPLEGDELDVYGEGEDAPQIAGIIDERPEEIKKLEQFKTSSKWRVITQDDGYNSKLKIEEIKKDVKGEPKDDGYNSNLNIEEIKNQVNRESKKDDGHKSKLKKSEVIKKDVKEVSGPNPKAIVRKGMRETSEDREKQKQKAERQKEIDAKYQRWGKGLKQLEGQEARYQDFLHESAKPLARHKGDTDLEAALKQMERGGDPMLQYMRQKKREMGDLGPVKPMYKGNYPPNRFNIRPGYRWDGVDRSNGYEKKYFDHQSKRKAQEEEAYRWSTEDL